MPDTTFEHPFPTVDMTKLGQIMRKLHDHVVGKRGRVEITRAGCEDRVVMISKAELDSLEQAVAIFADTAEFADMSDRLRDLLQSAGVVYAPQAVEDLDGSLSFAV